MSAYQGPMVQVKTAELIGKALDYAVAVVQGHPLCEECCHGVRGITIGTGRGDLVLFNPSTEWRLGGPLLDNYDVFFDRFHGGQTGVDNCVIAWCGWRPFGDPSIIREQRGINRLQAGMRAIVAATLGDTVSVPEESLE